MNRSRRTVAAAAGSGLVVLSGVFAATSHDQSSASPQSHTTVTQPTVPSPDQVPPWGHDDDRDSGAWPPGWPGSDADPGSQSTPGSDANPGTDTSPGTDATPATPGTAPSTSSRGS